MRRALTILKYVPAVLCGLLVGWNGCSSNTIPATKSAKDTFVEFKSELGYTFVAPSQWTAEDHGDTYTLKSPDSRAVIHVVPITAEVSAGSIKDCGDELAASLLPEGASGWAESKWSGIEIGNHKAIRKVLRLQITPQREERRLYLLEDGDLFYTIVVYADSEALTLNGDFYENVVRTFNPPRLQDADG